MFHCLAADGLVELRSAQRIDVLSFHDSTLPPSPSSEYKTRLPPKALSPTHAFNDTTSTAPYVYSPPLLDPLEALSPGQAFNDPYFYGPLLL